MKLWWISDICLFQLSLSLGPLDVYNKGRSSSVSSSISSDFGSGHSYHKAPGSEREDANVSIQYLIGISVLGFLLFNRHDFDFFHLFFFCQNWNFQPKQEKVKPASAKIKTSTKSQSFVHQKVPIKQHFYLQTKIIPDLDSLTASHERPFLFWTCVDLNFALCLSFKNINSSIDEEVMI